MPALVTASLPGLDHHLSDECERSTYSALATTLRMSPSVKKCIIVQIVDRTTRNNTTSTKRLILVMCTPLKGVFLRALQVTEDGDPSSLIYA
jgi:hypothetical protein